MLGNDKHLIPSSRGLEEDATGKGRHREGINFIANVSFLKLGSE